MHTISIPNTDLNPSSLCMGSGEFGAGIDRQDAFLLLDTFVEHGGTFIDTAKIYNDWIPGESSRSEKVIGEWMRLRKNRYSIILATKGAHFHLSTPHIPRLAPEEIISDLDTSLQNLQTNTIDLYWLHRDDPRRPIEEIMRTLFSQVQAGKIRYYGCSNWKIDRLQEAQAFAVKNNIPGFAAVQNMWSLAHINPGGIADPTIVVMEGPLFAYHQSQQLAAIPFSAQANGLFQKLAVGGIDSISPNLKRTYINSATEQRFSRSLQLHEQTGLTLSQIVLGYLLSQPFPTIPVFSSRNLEQLGDTLSAADVHLTKGQMAFLLS